ncbi:MAG: GntR family transcriptional regulator [Defluviitaleaceae bacterium]|nr:GntR family transcriptional regulator [Defluviitaleaceae bacterium]
MNDSQPVFMQIMEIIEGDIVRGVYEADDMIISTTQISKVYTVNPTTAVKAIGKLADAGILYKKRGIGMCLAPGARERITERRRNAFFNERLGALIKEAETLNISMDELVRAIKNKGVSEHD